MKEYNHTATICAISTPAGTGGIAVIRVAGEQAIAICERIFVARNEQKLSETKSHTVVFGQITAYSPRSNSNISDDNGCQLIDEVLVSVFRAPHSFTGDDTVEISCHGSMFIQQKILQLLVESGCRPANPGEFTQRAFINGKMDLSQAEAVADLIASQSESAHSMAMNQMRGGFSAELKELRSQLLNFTSLIELELDFSEEDAEFADREKLKSLALNIKQKINRLADSFRTGNVLKTGIPVALVGETNVGKSTLLNLLLNEEKAIVSDIHGTTRDVIEDTVNIQGITFRFIDTAGIRNTQDAIENLGIERTYRQIEKASIVLWLIDGTNVSEHIEWLTEKILKRAAGKKIILIFNKIDKLSAEELDILNSLFAAFNCERIQISAKLRLNTELLHKALLKAAELPQISEKDVIVSNIRHYEALRSAQNSISRVIAGLNDTLSADFLAQDIRETIHHLGEITGEITTDEVLGNIFKNFCIGK
ncbi:MAG: tRNA uridine-5-carboxymethylaminomethyl(34) synthesis GTPase MnmE [Prevotellaceae bacterium]|jgi:tRNA modification GTPase|nr:tRNA uridine-5-carboxymethylaminomethyl(34) synthesis GTPase MnmE [Prevotellaceae bacterium]